MAVWMFISALFGFLILSQMLHPYAINELISKKSYRCHVSKSTNILSFPSSNISTSLITPNNSPYTSISCSPIKHTATTTAIIDFSYIRRQLFIDQ